MSHLRYKDTALFQKFGESAYNNLWLLVNLIQTTRTVNLNKLKQEVGGLIQRKNGKITSSQSHYKRLTRFFEDFGDNEVFFLEASRILVQLLAKKGGRLLILDGTKWDKSSDSIHYLMLSIVIRGVSIPIYFVDLQKAGASSQEERISFIEKVLEQLNLKGMTVLGDREYIGLDWFKSLINNGLGFIIRTRQGDYERVYSEEKGKSYDKSWQKCLTKKKVIGKRLILNGLSLMMLFSPNKDSNAKEPVLVIVTTWRNKKEAAQTYSERWKIERMFRHMKTDGFNLEDNNLGSEGRRSLLTMLVCIAYAVTVRKVLDDKVQSSMVTRKNGTVHARESIFQMGMSLIAYHRRTMDRFIEMVSDMISTKNNPIISNV